MQCRVNVSRCRWEIKKKPSWKQVIYMEGDICERVKESKVTGVRDGLETESNEEQRARGKFYNHTGSIASSNKFDIDLYKDRPPSEGIYEATASATSVLILFGDINRACSPPCRNRA